MKPLVNLASEPFRNRRLFWLAVLLLFAIPSYLGLRAIKSMAGLETEITSRTSAVKGLDAQLKKFEKSAKSNVTLSSDQNRELLAASQLIARRAFSWSRLLNDIERNLPPTVRVRRVAVSQIQPDERDGTLGGNEIATTLTLDVIGKKGQEVTTMINKFHESGRFKVFPLQQKPIEGTEEVEFSLKVDYFPPQSEIKKSLSNQVAERNQ
ncbi:MAG: hypothetical protein L0226_14270 [Acidobacteria bacterium]|nr:hypothetical protein [Acidobacteriota bacterium]